MADFSRLQSFSTASSMIWCLQLMICARKSRANQGSWHAKHERKSRVLDAQISCRPTYRLHLQGWRSSRDTGDHWRWAPPACRSMLQGQWIGPWRLIGRAWAAIVHRTISLRSDGVVGGVCRLYFTLRAHSRAFWGLLADSRCSGVRAWHGDRR